MAGDNADVLAADNADVLVADNADVLAADTTDVFAADNKEAPAPGGLRRFSPAKTTTLATRSASQSSKDTNKTHTLNKGSVMGIGPASLYTKAKTLIWHWSCRHF